MKKLLSLMLVFVLLLSCISTVAFGLDTSAPVGKNLMKDYTYKDWKVTNRATINAPTESFSGDTSNAFSVTKLMWRSAYAEIKLEAGETYDLSFYYKEDAPEKVYITDAGNRGVILAYESDITFGDEATLKNNDHSKNLLVDVNYNLPSDKEGWNVVSATINPTVSGVHYLCFTGAAPDVNDLSLIHFSDFSLVKQGVDPNVFANTKAEDWISGWNGNKGETLNGAIAVKSAWRSAYTLVTLEPNTEYNFAFNASTVKVSDVRVYPESEITSDSQLVCPNGGGKLPGGTTDLAKGTFASTAPTDDFAGLSADAVTAYYTVSESFTTTDDTKYYVIIDCTQFLNNGADNPYCTFVHLNNLNLSPAASNEEPDDDPQQTTPNLLNDEVMKSLTWKALWGSSAAANNPKTADLDKAESYSGNSYAMAFGRTSRYRDNYTVLTLEPNTEYNFSFRYKADGVEEIVAYTGFVPASKTDFSTIKSDYVEKHLTDTSIPILGKDNATVGQEKNGVWNLVSTTFTTGADIQYVFYMGIGAYVDNSFKTITFSDFNLVPAKETVVDPNLLNDETMKSLEWTALWGTTTLNPKSGELNKSESYSGNSYAMTFGRNSRYRDNYTVLTLEPNTKYDFSFRYKADGVEEIVAYTGFVPVSKTDFSTIKGDHVEKHLTDTSIQILGKDNATVGQEKNGVWNLVSTTFTTGADIQYVFYMGIGAYVDNSFKTITFSDFNLVKNAGEEDDEDVEPSPEENADIDLLKDKTYKDWQVLSRATIKSPYKTYRTGATDGLTVEKMRYRSVYTTVNLEAGKNYVFTFYYASDDRPSTDLEPSSSGVRVIEKAGVSDNGEVITIKDGFANRATSFDIDVSERPGWQKVTAKIVTEKSGEYILALTGNSVLGADVNMHISDFNLVEYVKPFDKNDVMKYHTSGDWLITSRGTILKSNQVATPFDTTAFAVNKMRWRTIYTNVELEGGITYKVSFKYKDSTDTYLNDIMIAPEEGISLKEGDFQLTMNPGYINYAGTATLNKPSVEGFKEATCIFTPTDTGVYTFGINARGDSDATDVYFSDFKFLRYFDPATDVYGDVSAASGGTATNVGKQPYTKGETVTFTATPNSGNKFEGWFDANNQKVSSNETYTFTVDSDFELVAKFSGYNMPYVDWMKKNDMDGTFENGSMPGWYAMFKATGEYANWASFTPHTYVAHNGNKSMRIIARHQHSYFKFDNLSKNSDYYLSFYIYCADKDIYDSEKNAGFMLNEISLSVGEDLFWGKYNEFSEGGGGWHRVELFFNTGNYDFATLCLNYLGDRNIDEKAIYLDDVQFVKYFADGLDNGDFGEGKDHWMGEYSVSDDNGNKVAALSKGGKIYQSIAVEEHSLYTLTFRAKGNLLAAASKINMYSADVFSLLNSTTKVETKGDFTEYTFNIYTGVNKAFTLIFEALADGAMVDDIKLTKNVETVGGIIENIDFETERFEIRHSNTDVYEIFDGGEGSEFVRSGKKSLHFKFDAADKSTVYNFEDSYLDFQISNKRTYKLTFYYKTAKGNTFKISPDFLGVYANGIKIEQTAENDGWNKVNFYVSSSTAHYFKPLISNILNATKNDFYIDDISYTIVSAVVLENNVEKPYAEPPVTLLYNEGFENPITDKDWGKLPDGMKVIEGDTLFGNKFVRANGKTFYILPVAVETGIQYYFSAALRGTNGRIALSTTADGKGLFNGVTDKVESFLEPDGKKWTQKGIRFSAPTTGIVYVVIDVPKGYLEVDNVLIYKEQYALTEAPYGYDVVAPYDYEATSGKNYVLNGGYGADGSDSPQTGDTFPAITIVLITFAAAVSLLLSGRKHKKEAE